MRFLKTVIMQAAIPVMMCGVLSGCDTVFDESDCVASYNLIKFTYDHNLKFADAFDAEVEEITLWVFDAETGYLVSKHKMSREELLPGNEMVLDVDPGSYDLLVWGGRLGEDYGISEGTPGESKAEDFHCRLMLDSEGESKSNIARLYHRMMRMELPYASPSKPNHINLNLTKDTNTVRVVLQHLSGEPVDAEKFEFIITDGNSWLNADNSLRDNTSFVYRPHHTFSGSVDINTQPRDPKDGRVLTGMTRGVLGASLAEFTVSRLFMDNEPTLSVRNIETGKTVLSVNINDYALLVRGITHESMDKQEYLDRQDEYNMTFFLDEKGDWLSSVIIINNWRIVHVDQDIE